MLCRKANFFNPVEWTAKIELFKINPQKQERFQTEFHQRNKYRNVGYFYRSTGCRERLRYLLFFSETRNNYSGRETGNVDKTWKYIYFYKVVLTIKIRLLGMFKSKKRILIKKIAQLTRTTVGAQSIAPVRQNLVNCRRNISAHRTCRELRFFFYSAELGLENGLKL